MIPTAVGPVYQPFAVDLWSNLAPSRPCVQASIPKPNQTHLDHVPFPRLMNRSPICEAPTREKSPNPAGAEHSMRSAVSSGEKENQSMRMFCACARMCVRSRMEFLRSRTHVAVPLLHVFRFCMSLLVESGWQDPSSEICLGREKIPAPACKRTCSKEVAGVEQVTSTCTVYQDAYSTW